MLLRCSFRLDSKNDRMDCEIEEKNIGHIGGENSKMMCPTFLFVIFGNETFKMPFDKFKKSQKASKSLKKPYKSRITCLPLRWQLQQQHVIRNDGFVQYHQVMQFLFGSFLNRYSDCYRHSDHGVVTSGDQTYHRYVYRA